MKNKAFKLTAYKWTAIVFLGIFALGIFLRSYHFSDWLHFELDQSRDAKIIDLAIKEGPSNLPLLGPKAAGTFLRLGPSFYYFKYISALVFGDTPSGMAIIIMFFGIGAIPVFYLFVRRYFEKKLSLGLVLIFAVSLFLVMYSRFSWNPNSLPLFTMLAFYSLLRSVDKKEKNKGWWFLSFALSLGIATQMHFLAFVALPVISALYLMIKRPRINFKYWIAAAFLILLLYVPPSINDIITGGENIGQFLKVAEGKSSDDKHDIIEKVIKNYNEHALGYFTILSGRGDRELPRITFQRDNFFTFICDSGCWMSLKLGILAILFFTGGIIVLVRNFFRKMEPEKKDFILLNILWFLVAFGLYVSIAYDISPRFFLLSAALPIIFFGFIVELVLSKIKSFPGRKIIFIILIFLPVLSNLAEIKKRFWEMKNAPFVSFKPLPDRMLKEKTRVTLEQQYNIVNYIESIYQGNNYPIYLNSEPFYRRSLLYHLEKRNILREDFRNVTGSQKVYREGNYFLIYPTESNWENDLNKYADNYREIGRKPFGTLTLFQLSPKEEAINAERQEFEEKGEPKTSPGVPERFRWEEIFNDASDDGEESN